MTPVDINNSGVYMILNNVNGKVYVGRAVSIRKRWIQHRHYLRNGNHHNSYLQRAWDKYGEECFSFLILVGNVKDESDLCSIENYYINSYSAVQKGFGYNLCPSSGTNRGVKYSDESKARMSAAQKGRTLSEEHRRKIADTLTGQIPSEECRMKRSIAMTGRLKSPEVKQRMRVAQRVSNKTKEYEAFGKSQTLRDWADEYGINKNTLENRVLRSGETIESALTGEKRSSKNKGTATFVVFGVIASVLEHANTYGVSVGTIRNYMGRNKLTAQAAIELAIFRKNGND